MLELIGPPGIGKSRIAMAFALAECFRLEGGKVLVIGESQSRLYLDQLMEAKLRFTDAEGSLNPGLLHETATAYAVHNGCELNMHLKVSRVS